MFLSVIQIGNSRGIRIPKAVLDQLDIGEEVQLEIKEKKMIVHAVAKKPRNGWGDSFKEMRQNGEDALLIDDFIDTENFDWAW